MTIGHAYIRFEAGESGLNVFSETDVGYIEHLECDGYMSNTYTVLPDENGVAELVFKAVGNHSNEFKVVWVRGTMYYSIGGTDGIFSVELKDWVFYATITGKTSQFVTHGSIPVARS